MLYLILLSFLSLIHCSCFHKIASLLLFLNLFFSFWKLMDNRDLLVQFRHLPDLVLCMVGPICWINLSARWTFYLYHIPHVVRKFPFLMSDMTSALILGRVWWGRQGSRCNIWRRNCQVQESCLWSFLFAWQGKLFVVVTVLLLLLINNYYYYYIVMIIWFPFVHKPL